MLFRFTFKSAAGRGSAWHLALKNGGLRVDPPPLMAPITRIISALTAKHALVFTNARMFVFCRVQFYHGPSAPTVVDEDCTPAILSALISFTRTPWCAFFADEGQRPRADPSRALDARKRFPWRRQLMRTKFSCARRLSPPFAGIAHGAEPKNFGGSVRHVCSSSPTTDRWQIQPPALPTSTSLILPKSWAVWLLLHRWEAGRALSENEAKPLERAEIRRSHDLLSPASQKLSSA